MINRDFTIYKCQEWEVKIETLIAELKKNSEILNKFVDKDLIVTKAMEQLTQCRDGEGSSLPVTISKTKRNQNKKKNKGQESSENIPI